MDAGFTEPDPKIDLSGVDVARKILILARESGLQMELSEIENESWLLPQECLDTKDNESFLSSLDYHNDHFKSLFNTAASKNCRLKYVAELVDGKAKVGLKKFRMDTISTIYREVIISYCSTQTAIKTNLSLSRVLALVERSLLQEYSLT